MRTLLAASIALCVLALCADARAQETEGADGSGDDDGPVPELRDEYRRVVAEGVSEFAAGHWAEARAAFLRGHELWPSARTLRSLGMTSFELRAYARAAIELQAALDDTRRPLSPEQRTHVGALLEQTRAFVGRFRVQLSPSDAQLLVDGAPFAGAPPIVLVLEVGRHELVARAPGHEVLRRPLDVQGHEEAAIVFELQPSAIAGGAAAPSPAAAAAARADARPVRGDPRADSDGGADGGGRLWTWIAGGTAVALAAASTAFWLHSRAEYDAIDERCARVQCERGELDESPFSTPQTAHHVTLALALVAGAGAVVLFFVEGEPRAGERAPLPTAQVSVGAGGVSVRGAL